MARAELGSLPENCARDGGEGVAFILLGQLQKSYLIFSGLQGLNTNA